MRKAAFCFYTQLPKEEVPLPAPFFDRIEQIRHPRRKQESRIAYFLLARLMQEEGVDFSQLSFIDGHFTLKDFYLSLSHTEGGIGVLLSTHNDTIDLEVIQAHPFCAKRILSRSENRELAKGWGSWIECWTMKECLIKQNIGFEQCAYNEIDTTRFRSYGHFFVYRGIGVQILEEVELDHEENNLLYERTRRCRPSEGAKLETPRIVSLDPLIFFIQDLEQSPLWHI